jgi:hypothetical protein
MPGTTVPMSEVRLLSSSPLLFVSPSILLSSHYLLSSPIPPHTNTPSIPFLPPPLHLHVHRLPRNHNVLPPQIATHIAGTTHGAPPRHHLLGARSRLFINGFGELHEDDRQVRAADGDCADGHEDAVCECEF